uniref:Lipase domain-containing protein n=1 Tax=Steinernema glaseri TaxID=37863 RepID=A0A1I7YSF9_9BILA
MTSPRAFRSTRSLSGWNGPIEFFMAKGYSSAELYALTWGDRNLGNSGLRQHTCDYVRRIRAFIEAVLEYTGSGKVDIVAHSMGVTLARRALKGGNLFLGDDCDLGAPIGDRVDAFLGIAGANYAVDGMDPSSSSWPRDIARLSSTLSRGAIETLAIPDYGKTPFFVKTEEVFRQHTCDYVSRIRAFIEAVLEYTDSGKVDVVAHSMGVTLARRALKGGNLFLGNDCDLGAPIGDRVDAFLGIAGANYGVCSCTGETALVVPVCSRKFGFWAGDSCFPSGISSPSPVVTCQSATVYDHCVQEDYGHFLKQLNEENVKEAGFVLSMWSEGRPSHPEAYSTSPFRRRNHWECYLGPSFGIYSFFRRRPHLQGATARRGEDEDWDGAVGCRNQTLVHVMLLINPRGETWKYMCVVRSKVGPLVNFAWENTIIRFGKCF